MRHQARRGFSLIELLVVIAVLGVVTTIGTTMFFKVNDLWRKSTTQTRLENKVDLLDENLRIDLGMTISPALSGIPLRVETRSFVTGEQGLSLQTSYFDDVLVVPVEEIGHPQPRHKVVYAVVGRETVLGMGTLVRGVLPLDAELPEKIDGTPLIEGVSSFRVECHDGAEWETGWSGDRMPCAVRVSVGLADERNPAFEQMARKMAYSLQVR